MMIQISFHLYHYSNVKSFLTISKNNNNNFTCNVKFII